MLNMNSPIVNNMMGFGVSPNPIGNTMSMGMGYNNMGGYYGGYNNYVNPYALQQQQQAYEAKVREQQRQSSDSMKALARAAAIASGYPVDEEYLSQRYDPVYETPYTQQEVTQANLMNTYFNSMNYNREEMMAQYRNIAFDREKQRVPDNISLLDFFDNANQELAEMERNQLKSQQRKGIKNLYNSDEFKQLINMHSNNGNSYFSNIYNNNTTSINDMEVQLPSHLTTPYQEKRKKFLEMIGMR